MQYTNFIKVALQPMQSVLAILRDEAVLELGTKKDIYIYIYIYIYNHQSVLPKGSLSL